MRKHILQPEKIIKILLIFASLFFLSGSARAEKKKNPDLDREDLLFYETIIVDFYSSSELKEKAIRDLENRCRFRDSANGLSCANLAILYKSKGDLPKAYTASAKAYKKEPRNNYYRNLFMNLAIRSGNLRDMEKRMGRDGNVFSRINRVVESCNLGWAERAIPDLVVLVKEKQITKEQLERGLFYDCLSEDPDLLSQLHSLAKGNPLSYTNLLREEEDKHNPFHTVWDVDYYRKEVAKTLKEKELPRQILTRIWVDLKNSLQEKDQKKALTGIRELKEELNRLKRSGKNNRLLAESLDLGIQLTLEQDPDLSPLAKEMDITW